MSEAQETAEFLFKEQQRLVSAFSEFDGCGRFERHEWRRQEFGKGCIRTLEGGKVFERASVNVSLVQGREVPSVIADSRPDTLGKPYSVTGISMVLHPRNPYAPSFHANFRFFGITDDQWWFGGGCDLTPCYGFDEDAIEFHRTLKAWADRHDPTWYPEWKFTCDNYFTIPHRREMRGIGGVFFDNLTDHDTGGFRRCMDAVVDGLDTILPAYVPILERRHRMPYGERERQWQLFRRGRYIEFNLVYDRGTLFGLQTGGNIEAILVSMPPLARWGFDIKAEPGSAESELARFLRPHDWAGQAT